FYGTDLSNRVRYLGMAGPHGAFNAIPSCREFRAAVNAADLDYLVTAPELNFVHPGAPIASPEAAWLRGERAVRPILHSGPLPVCRGEAQLDPSAGGPANAPLRRIPQQPSTGAATGALFTLWVKKAPGYPGARDELSARERALPVGGGLALTAGNRRRA